MRPVLLVVVRPLMLLAVIGAVLLGYRATGRPDGLASGVLVGQLCINVVNLVSYLLLRGAVRREGTRLRDLVGYRRDRLGRDVAWGLLWLLVLYTGFGIVLTLMPLALFRPDSAAEFAAAYTTTFVGDVARADPVPVPVAVSIMGFVVFAFTNPLVEEMTFRAYAQQRLVTRWGSAWAGIGVPAVAFGLQHMLFAYSLAGMATLGAAFLVWGLLSGVIYHRQQRLVPLVTAHFVVNLGLGAAVPIAVIVG